MNIGEYTKKYREEQGMTQQTFAEKAGLARSFIARLERGDFEDGSISFGTFIRLSKALDVSLRKLFADVKFNDGSQLPPMGAYLQRARKSNSNSKK